MKHVCIWQGGEGWRGGGGGWVGVSLADMHVAGQEAQAAMEQEYAAMLQVIMGIGKIRDMGLTRKTGSASTR